MLSHNCVFIDEKRGGKLLIHRSTTHVKDSGCLQM